MRVLIVEDSPDLAYGLETNLQIEGYETKLATDGELALHLYDEFRPDIVILDLMIPKLNGYGVLQALRDRGSHVPVLILSAQKEEAAKIRGFRLGADDFVTKPFSVLELMARIEALLRRAKTQEKDAAGTPSDENRVRFGKVDVDLTTQAVFRNGEKVDLAPKAYDLLIALMRRRGAVVKRQDLLKEVWGHRQLITTRTVDLHVLELRRKLEDDPSNPQHLLTVRKAGYRFQR
ncbi:MAG TPA: response regulator transcription factor [Longimicrobiales bacterium]|nr:response regulator transcription factor [Longimicrobiales bacterium]